jgi:hypothetical protein
MISPEEENMVEKEESSLFDGFAIMRELDEIKKNPNATVEEIDKLIAKTEKIITNLEKED